MEFHTEKHNTEVFVCDIVILITIDENLFLPGYSWFLIFLAEKIKKTLRCELCPYLKICVRDILSLIKGALVEWNEIFFICLAGFIIILKIQNAFAFSILFVGIVYLYCVCNSAFKPQLLQVLRIAVTWLSQLEVVLFMILHFVQIKIPVLPTFPRRRHVHKDWWFIRCRDY